MHDDFICDDLYNVDIDARNAAYRYVMGTPPTEPEMWLSLSDMKFVHRFRQDQAFHRTAFRRCAEQQVDATIHETIPRQTPSFYAAVASSLRYVSRGLSLVHEKRASERGVQNGVALEH